MISQSNLSPVESQTLQESLNLLAKTPVNMSGTLNEDISHLKSRETAQKMQKLSEGQEEEEVKENRQEHFKLEINSPKQQSLVKYGLKKQPIVKPQPTYRNQQKNCLLQLSGLRLKPVVQDTGKQLVFKNGQYGAFDSITKEQKDHFMVLQNQLDQIWSTMMKTESQKMERSQSLAEYSRLINGVVNIQINQQEQDKQKLNSNTQEMLLAASKTPSVQTEQIKQSQQEIRQASVQDYQEQIQQPVQQSSFVLKHQSKQRTQEILNQSQELQEKQMKDSVIISSYKGSPQHFQKGAGAGKGQNMRSKMKKLNSKVDSEIFNQSQVILQHKYEGTPGTVYRKQGRRKSQDENESLLRDSQLHDYDIENDQKQHMMQQIITDEKVQEVKRQSKLFQKFQGQIAQNPQHIVSNFRLDSPNRSMKESCLLQNISELRKMEHELNEMSFQRQDVDKTAITGQIQVQTQRSQQKSIKIQSQTFYPQNSRHHDPRSNTSQKDQSFSTVNFPQTPQERERVTRQNSLFQKQQQQSNVVVMSRQRSKNNVFFKETAKFNEEVQQENEKQRANQSALLTYHKDLDKGDYSTQQNFKNLLSIPKFQGRPLINQNDTSFKKRPILLPQSQNVSPRREDFQNSFTNTNGSSQQQRVFDPENRPKPGLSSINMTQLQDSANKSMRATRSRFKKKPMTPNTELSQIGQEQLQSKFSPAMACQAQILSQNIRVMGNKNSRYRHFESLKDKKPKFKPQIVKEEQNFSNQISNPTFRPREDMDGSQTPFSNKMIQKHTEIGSKEKDVPLKMLQSKGLNFSMAEIELKKGSGPQKQQQRQPNKLRASTAVTSKVNSKATSPMESYRKEIMAKQKYLQNNYFGTSSALSSARDNTGSKLARGSAFRGKQEKKRNGIILY